MMSDGAPEVACRNWGVRQVQAFFRDLKLDQYVHRVREFGIDGITLQELVKTDSLDKMGVANRFHQEKVRAGLQPPPPTLPPQMPRSTRMPTSRGLVRKRKALPHPDDDLDPFYGGFEDDDLGGFYDDVGLGASESDDPTASGSTSKRHGSLALGGRGADIFEHGGSGADSSDFQWHRCEFCDMRFRSAHSVRTHTAEVHHILPETYECDLCGHCSYSPGDLKRHRFKKHGVAPRRAGPREKRKRENLDAPVLGSLPDLPQDTSSIPPQERMRKILHSLRRGEMAEQQQQDEVGSSRMPTTRELLPRRVVRSRPISVRVRTRERRDHDGFDDVGDRIDDFDGRGGSLRDRIDSFRDEEVDCGDGLGGSLGGSLGSRIDNFDGARVDGLSGMVDEFIDKDDGGDGNGESLAERIDAQKRLRGDGAHDDFGAVRPDEGGRDDDDDAPDLVDCNDEDEEGV